MNTQKETLIVNYITVTKTSISVGVTNKERWGWEIDDGYNGADATTLIFTKIEIEPGMAPLEIIEMPFCHPGDPLRNLVLNSIPNILDIAWQIKDKNLSLKSARQEFFGYEIKRSI